MDSLLNNIMSTADQLFPIKQLQDDPAAREQAARMNRGLFQLLRIVTNMSDASRYCADTANRQESRDICALLEEIFSKCPISISIKTRIGLHDPEEFSQLLKIYNQYPVKELTVHARTREEYYRGQVHMESFEQALADSKIPLCYNGDLFSRKKISDFAERFPECDHVMIGRGLLIDPSLASGQELSREKLKQFHDKLIADYLTVLAPQDTLFKMKELSSWIMRLFPEEEKAKKQIRKAQNLTEYKAAAAHMIQNGRIEPVENFIY